MCIQCGSITVYVWMLSKAVPETMVWVHAVYCMVAPGGMVRKLVKQEHKRNIPEQVTAVGN